MKHAREVGIRLRGKRGTRRSVVLLVLVGLLVQGPVVSSAAYRTGVHAGGSAEHVSVSQGLHRSAPKTSHPSSQKLWTFNYTTCATSDGVVRCWGSALNPVFGVPTSERASVYSAPVVIGPTLPNLTSLSSYVFYACGVSNGGVKCWGEVHEGVIGNPSGGFLRTPIEIAGLTSGVTSVAVGNLQACAVAGGSLRCWGLQDRFNNYRRTMPPKVVAGLESGVEAFVGRDGHRCVLIRGGVKCEGYNGDGELGDGGTRASYGNFVDVVGLPSGSGVTAIDAGFGASCAIVNGGVKCWGDGETGRLGNSNVKDSSTPVDVSGLGSGSGVTAISTSRRHTCAIVNSGVQCWGQNTFGQLGDGTRKSSTVPVQVLGIGPGSGATDVAVGYSHTCAIVRGDVFCWGSNGNGSLGDGSGKSSSTPVGVLGLSTPGGVTTPTTTIRPTATSTTVAGKTQLNLRFTNNPYIPESFAVGTRPEICPKVMIVGLRGSSERPKPYFIEGDPKKLNQKGQRYTNWSPKTGFTPLLRYSSINYTQNQTAKGFFNLIFGETVGPHVVELRQRLALNLGLGIAEVGVWSVGVDDLHLDPRGNLPPQSVYHASDVKGVFPVLQTYIDAIGNDIGRISEGSFIYNYTETACPETLQYYFIGYSQGAIFARLLAVDLVKLSPRKFKGLMLLADPLFHGTEDLCCYAQAMSRNHIQTQNGLGARGAGWLKPKGESLESALRNGPFMTLSELERYGGVLTVCRKGDIVCDFGLSNVKSGPGTHSNSYKVSSAATQSCVAHRISYLLTLATSSGEQREVSKRSVKAGNLCK